MSTVAKFPITDGEQTINELRLRPFTIGTFELCKNLNLTMFFDGQIPDDTSERFRQVSIYLFIQSQPLDHVLSVIEAADFEKNHLRKFQFSLTPAMLEKAVDMIGRNLMGAGEMVVEVQQRESLKGGNDDVAPPNSLSQVGELG